MNRCNFVGNLTEDISLTTVDCAGGTPKSKAIIKMAVKSIDYDTVFLEFTAWGATAEMAAKHIRKGMLATIEARVENNNYDKDNLKISSYRFIAKRVEAIPLPKLKM